MFKLMELSMLKILHSAENSVLIEFFSKQFILSYRFLTKAAIVNFLKLTLLTWILKL